MSVIAINRITNRYNCLVTDPQDIQQFRHPIRPTEAMSRPPFLFGGSSGGQTRSQYLVEFRAGKMTQNGSTVSIAYRRRMSLKVSFHLLLGQSSEGPQRFGLSAPEFGRLADALLLERPDIGSGRRRELSISCPSLELTSDLTLTPLRT